MAINTVAILSPGDMGHAVGRLLREHELRVGHLFGRRSDRPCSRPAGRHCRCAQLNELVQQSDLVMSITVSEAAPQVCRQVADAIRDTRRDISVRRM